MSALMKMSSHWPDSMIDGGKNECLGGVLSALSHITHISH